MDKASFAVVALIWTSLINLLSVYTMLETYAFNDLRIDKGSRGGAPYSGTSN